MKIGRTFLIGLSLVLIFWGSDELVLAVDSLGHHSAKLSAMGDIRNNPADFIIRSSSVIPLFSGIGILLLLYRKEKKSLGYSELEKQAPPPPPRDSRAPLQALQKLA